MKSSLAALAFGVVLSGCSTRAPEPSLPPVTPRPLAIAPAPAPTVMATPDPIATYSYVPVGKRDPFRVDIELPPPPPPDHGCDDVLAPLCRYSLDELKLTGVVSGMGNPVAVFESPRGKGYSVYRGSRIGRNGMVTKILRDAVVVVESWPTPQGDVHKEEVVLRMRADAPLDLGE